MKKNLLASILFMAIFTSTHAQTAVDFTANDCDGVSHNLFTELNSGKVIVMSFVMPCGACISATLTGYNIAQSYATSHPGQVLFYVSDDEANTTCLSLTGWVSNNIDTGIVTFSNAVIDQNNFGQPGMPKVVVMGGANHAIYYNQNDGAAGNSTAIQVAVNLALSEIAGVNEASELNFSIELFPNPSHSNLNVSFVSPTAQLLKFQMVNATGQVIYQDSEVKANSGLNNLNLNMDQIPAGIYFFKIASSSVYQVKKIIVE